LFLEHVLDEHVTTFETSSYFGPKLNKNGWKYEYLEPSSTIQIKKLCQKVYNQEEVTNKQLSLKFVQSLVAKINGHPNNWAKHVTYVKKLREHFKIRKVENEKKSGRKSFDEQCSFNITTKEYIKRCFVLEFRRKFVLSFIEG